MNQVGEEDGVFWIKIEFEDMLLFRNNLSKMLGDKKIEYASVILPMSSENPRVARAFFQQYKLEHLTTVEDFSTFYIEFFAKCAVVTASIRPLMKENITLTFLSIGFGSISETASASRIEVRPGAVALSGFIKSLSFEFPEGIIAGIIVGAWRPGFKSLTQKEASDRFINTGFRLDPKKHNGRIVTYNMEIVPY